MEKRCSKCGVIKDAAMFRTRLVARDGLRSHCRACELKASREYDAAHRDQRAAKSRKYRNANPEKVRAAHAAWRTANPDRYKQLHAACLARHPDRAKARKRRYYTEHTDDLKNKARLYYQRNKAVIRTKQKEYGARNPEVSRAAKARYAKAHPDIIKASKKHWRIGKDRLIADYAYKRLTQMRNATPPWLSEQDKEAIEATYAQAKRLSDSTGIRYQVDHIVPLQGRDVSGLHVPWNLQILTEAQNIRKGNRVLTA